MCTAVNVGISWSQSSEGQLGTREGRQGNRSSHYIDFHVITDIA